MCLQLLFATTLIPHNQCLEWLKKRDALIHLVYSVQPSSSYSKIVFVYSKVGPN